MKKIDELQQLKGVGPVLAKRLKDAGLDSYRAVSEGGVEALRRVKGMNQLAVPGIVQQASLLVDRDGEGAAEGSGDLPVTVERMRETVQTLGKNARERFAGKISGRTGRRLGENLVRISDALERIEQSAKHRKRCLKALSKVQRKIEALDQAKLKKFCRGLKKSRKALAELAR